MYTAEALADIHERTHESLAMILAHADALGQEGVERTLPGFGYPTIRLQIHHVIGAERYWIGVIHGRMVGDDDEAAFPTISSLAALRAEVAALTRAYLAGASAAELNTPRPMVTWGGKEKVLMPARVVLRTQTHVYQHQGQITAMARLLGSPLVGSDFPIV